MRERERHWDDEGILETIGSERLTLTCIMFCKPRSNTFGMFQEFISTILDAGSLRICQNALPNAHRASPHQLNMYTPIKVVISATMCG